MCMFQYSSDKIDPSHCEFEYHNYFNDCIKDANLKCKGISVFLLGKRLIIENILIENDKISFNSNYDNPIESFNFASCQCGGNIFRQVCPLEQYNLKAFYLPDLDLKHVDNGYIISCDLFGNNFVPYRSVINCFKPVVINS